MERLNPEEMHPSMRGRFAGELFNQMLDNPDIVVITADLGYGMWDRIQEHFPERYINVGAAEQAAVGVACGMALKGKIPFVYSITPFLLARPYEWIRNYVNHEYLPVKLVGAGRDFDYMHDGFTHHARDARAILSTFPNIAQYWPKDEESIKEVVETLVSNGLPSFISLRR